MVIRRPDDSAAGAGTAESSSGGAVACCHGRGSAAATCTGTGADFFGVLLRDAGTFPAAAFFAGVFFAAVAVFAGVLFLAVAVFGSGAATGSGSSSRPMGAAGGSGSAGPVCAGADFPAGVRFVPEAAFRAFGALAGAGPCRSPAG
ncbi:hypothetical protein [Micromonospora avicenniae]|uniref:hypothetical protein n=1 Tax=Micromonospora avicenniae TaxID=1198245 RepID=UPI001FE83B25|nr:hypothetical protein [Micromonospora avicenniae]